jgi:hypothetical protein
VAHAIFSQGRVSQEALGPAASDLLNGRQAIIAMAEPPFGGLVGALKSDSPTQTPSPEEVRTPPETPGDTNQAAAPPQGGRQNVLGNQGITANDEQATELLQSVGPLTVQPMTTGGADESSAQHNLQFTSPL